MTLIVGIRCSDGVVMASDSAATFAAGIQPTIGQQQITKIRPLSDSMLYSSSGAIGIAQLISEVIGRLWATNQTQFLNYTPPEAMHRIGGEIAKIIAVYVSNGNLLRQDGGMVSVLCKSLLAVPLKDGPCLVQFDFSGAPEEVTREIPFVALGAGQQIADPFLAFLRRILWKEREPTVSEGRFAAAWTIEHAIQTNPGGIAGPLQMATLTGTAGKPKIDFKDPAEQQQAVGDVERVLSEHIHNSLGSGTAEPTEVPKPEK